MSGEQLSIPPKEIEMFLSWCAVKGLVLDPDNPKGLEDLHRVLVKGEARLVYEAGQWIREGRVSQVNVLFHDSLGVVWQLAEIFRGVLPEGMSFEEWREEGSRVDQLISSGLRIPTASVSERLGNEEDPRTGAVRGLLEELFESMKGMTPERLRELELIFINKLVDEPVQSVISRGADDPNNSYRGLASRLTRYGWELHLDASDRVVPLDIEGKPLPMYEHVPREGGGYVNIFGWSQG